MAPPKPIQIVARHDGAFVTLSASGDLYSQVRGEWEKLAGIAGERIASIAIKPSGALLAITTVGRIYEQHRVGVHIGDHSQGWRPVAPLPDK